MNFRLQVRRLTNIFLNAVPTSLSRHLLKSIACQRPLQDRLAFHVSAYNFDSPIPVRKDVDPVRLEERRMLPGLRFEEEKYLRLLDELQPFAEEFAKAQPIHAQPGAEFWFQNGAYGDHDAITLYAMIRHLRPARIIEVGSGFSSRVITLASRRNAAEGKSAACTFIEPYPSEMLKSFPLAGSLVVKKIEEIPLQTFEALRAGDILFIDTSHVIKCQNDCCYELLTILPSLPAGVYVHVHDIFTPFDYPASWMFERQFSFNEQYALECLLTHNPRLEIILPVYHLYRTQRERMAKLYSGAKDMPAAFWLRTC